MFFANRENTLNKNNYALKWTTFGFKREIKIVTLNKSLRVASKSGQHAYEKKKLHEVYSHIV